MYATVGRINHKISDYDRIEFEGFKINVIYDFNDSNKENFLIHYRGGKSDDALLGWSDSNPSWIILQCNSNNQIKLVKSPNYYYVDEDGKESEFGFQRIREIDEFICPKE